MLMQRVRARRVTHPARHRQHKDKGVYEQPVDTRVALALDSDRLTVKLGRERHVVIEPFEHLVCTQHMDGIATAASPLTLILIAILS